MNFTADRKHIADALKMASACVARNTILPLLANVLFEAKDGKVTITCMNMEQRISASFAADITKDGTTTLPALKLLNLLGKLTGDSVTICTNTDNEVSEITCGTTYMKIAGLPATDYPDKPETTALVTFSVDTKDLTTSLAKGGYAVSADDSRKVLTGVLFDIDSNGITIVSTDGKRLACVEYACPVVTETAKQFVIPAAAVTMLGKFKGDKVEFAFSDDYVNAKVGDIDFQSKLIPGSFPNYKAVIPSGMPEKVEINADEFLAKLSLVSAMVTATDQTVAFSFDGEKLKMCAGGAEGIIDDNMSIYTPSPFKNPVGMNFNPAFLTAAVSACAEGTFTVFFKDGVNPVVFEFDSNTKTVIMPIRPK